MFSLISGVTDTLVLQDDLSSFKSKFLWYHRTSTVTEFTYKLNGVEISRTNTVKNLGVIFEPQLNFNQNFDALCSKANRLLGFIFRETQEFPYSRPFIQLYKALVIPILMYDSPISSPYKIVDIKQIESVQHHFLRMLSRKTGWPMHPFDHDFSVIASRFSIIILEALRAHSDLAFIFNVLSKKIHCTDFEQVIKFRNLSYSFRNPPVFQLQKQLLISVDYTYIYATTMRFCKKISNINHASLFKKKQDSLLNLIIE